MAIPQTMKAIQISAHGGLEVIQFSESAPTPKAGSSNILVKVEWAGVNYIDNYVRTGLYPNPLGFPLTVGAEAAGTIAALPDAPLNDPAYAARNFHVGQRVALFAPQAYAEYQSAPWQRVFPVPDGVDSRTAAASLLQGMTVVSDLNESYPAKAGDTVLVHAAAGGLGLIFCQVLKAIGAYVIGTTSTKEKAALAKAHGADEVIIYSGPDKEDVEARVLELTGGKGVHCVLDGVGKDTWELDFKVIRKLGTIVFVGNASGPVPPFPVLKLAEKNTKICRPTLNNSVEDPENGLRYANQVFDEILKGQLKINVHAEYPLSAEGLRDALTALTGRATTGKLLIKIAP